MRVVGIDNVHANSAHEVPVRMEALAVALLALRAHPEDRPRPPEAGPEVLPADDDPVDINP